MTQKYFNVKFLTLTAMIAAIYVALTLVNYNLSFMAIQLRLSEALTLLPFLMPQAIPGLFIGCAVANLFSPIQFPYDFIFGSLATLLAAYLTYKSKNKYIAPIPPIVINGVVVGLLLTVFFNEGNEAFLPIFLFNFASVAIGEAIVCYGIGVVLITYLEKILYKIKE